MVRVVGNVCRKELQQLSAAGKANEISKLSAGVNQSVCSYALLLYTVINTNGTLFIVFRAIQLDRSTPGMREKDACCDSNFAVNGTIRRKIEEKIPIRVNIIFYVLHF